MERLLDAVKAGFRDFDAMEEDPDLEPIRSSQTYAAIMEARERVERGVERNPSPRSKSSRGPTLDPLAVWRAAHGDEYRYEIDADRGQDAPGALAQDEAQHGAYDRVDEGLAEEHGEDGNDEDEEEEEEQNVQPKKKARRAGA